MEQLRDYGDVRNKGFCVYCGGREETRDHAPPKVFLDRPFPENLPVCPSCFHCNNSLSIDEEYVACLLECVLSGHADARRLKRPRIREILSERPSLLTKLQRARSDGEHGPVWSVDMKRIEAVILKLARAHFAFELNEPQLDEPTRIECAPLITMGAAQKAFFENSALGSAGLLPEVGSRSLQRMLVSDNKVYLEGWIIVQEGNYRYSTSYDGGKSAKMVIREYLACQVFWN